MALVGIHVCRENIEDCACHLAGQRPPLQNLGVGMEGLYDVGMEGLHKSHLPKGELLSAQSVPPAGLPLVGLPRSLVAWSGVESGFWGIPEKGRNSSYGNS